MIVYLTPVAKPRMTRSDKWKKRPVTDRYWKFKNEWKKQVPSALDLNYKQIEFVMPMPKSWSKKKRAEMDGKPHTQKPDLDNLLKGIGDAHYQDDSVIHCLDGIKKTWGVAGFIVITNQDCDLPW
jgi:Holliday junction resolvase RusA-like endonuclease